MIAHDSTRRCRITGCPSCDPRSARATDSDADDLLRAAALLVEAAKHLRAVFERKHQAGVESALLDAMEASLAMTEIGSTHCHTLAFDRVEDETAELVGGMEVAG